VFSQASNDTKRMLNMSYINLSW